MDKDKIQAAIYSWIEKLDFKDLTQQQKTFVENSLSQQEYEKMRHAYLQSVSYFKKDKSGMPKIGGFKDISKKITPKKEIAHFLQRSIPIYQAAAAAILLLLIASFLTYTLFVPNQTNYIQLTDTVYIKQKDTVHVVEKIKIPEKKNITKSKNTYKTVEKKTPTQKNKLQNQKINYVNHELVNISPEDIEKIGNQNKGTSLAEDSMLNEYIISVN